MSWEVLKRKYRDKGRSERKIYQKGGGIDVEGLEDKEKKTKEE